MAASYQSKDSAILNQQLKVQELCVRFADVGLYTVSSTVITVDIKETLESCTLAIFKDNSATPVLSALPAASITVSGTTIAVDVGVAFAANDVLVLKYVVAE